MSQRGEIIWQPPSDARERTRIGRYMAWLESERGLSFDDYAALWQWSVTDLDGFWRSIWDYFALESSTAVGPAVAGAMMPGTRWFPGVELNYARHALRRTRDGPAVITRSQTRDAAELTMDELRDQVARCRAGLVRLGVGRGDRVVAYLPNIPEAVVAFLATASLGAIWSSCAPEFGARSVIDRWAQIDPKVLVTIDGYRYGTKAIDRTAQVAAIRAELPSLDAVVSIGYLDAASSVEGGTTWDELLSTPADLTFDPVPFDHPLYVLFSSGTTGSPKPIVHGHGGIVVEHHKVLALHNDLGPDDRFFWFSTTGWMMWNYLVSGLLVGATIVLFDGDPGAPDLGALWQMAGELQLTFFGTSAPFILAGRRAGIEPRAIADLSSLRSVGSTGAPLPPEGFTWVHDMIGEEVPVSSISGGTDVCTAFVGGCPLVPVRKGEISCRYLGVRVEAYDTAGRSIIGTPGELVITAPMPSMPVGFWSDPSSERYRAAYFADHPGVWTHGDWITIYDDGACVITGRSDATLNRGGVRMGTAELYSVVDSVPGVVDSLAVHLEDAEGGPGRLILFLVLSADTVLDDDLRHRIGATLRRELSPRHVPDEIHQVPGVPRTLSGKKLEVPVKRILAGEDLGVVAVRGSLANPEVLDAFSSFRRG